MQTERSTKRKHSFQTFDSKVQPILCKDKQYIYKIQALVWIFWGTDVFLYAFTRFCNMFYYVRLPISSIQW